MASFDYDVVIMIDSGFGGRAAALPEKDYRVKRGSEHAVCRDAQRQLPTTG